MLVKYYTKFAKKHNFNIEQMINELQDIMKVKKIEPCSYRGTGLHYTNDGAWWIPVTKENLDNLLNK